MVEKELVHNELLLIEPKTPAKSITAKIICIGDCSVGKTSIICRFIQNRFKESSSTTLGVEYFKKKLRIGNEEVFLEIWDTAGQERYRSLVKFFYKNAKGALLVFDLCDRDSFYNLEFWLKSVKTNSNQDLIIFILGNKCDIHEKRQVNSEEIHQFCQQHDVEFFFETSAKENIQINQVFDELGKKIKEKIDKQGGMSSFLNSNSSEISDLKMEKGCTICEC